ncbi:MAG: hypothetical protein K0R91_417 [Nitrososphaeraceae archaeon]|jgi:hypothetical protein|nr:hypothetical protein [Nitrososphaeraceae archaeon]
MYIARTTIIKIEVRKIMPTLLVRLMIVRAIARNNSDEMSPKNEKITIIVFNVLFACKLLTLYVIPSSNAEVAPRLTNAESTQNAETEKKKSGDRTQIHRFNHSELLGNWKCGGDGV